ncbi:MAG: helix-turn-helix domain-containing protein [Aulosira sp. DedQUE10]|nr:helix-turn-helix domain-containing protein [Aulosira sp. DedQUE10]
MLLLMDDGKTYQEISETLGYSYSVSRSSELSEEVINHK